MPTTYSAPRPIADFDTECYPNYWAIAFKCAATGRVRRFEKLNDSALDRAGIAKILRNYRVYGFNSNNYDMPMVALAMSGVSNAELKRANDRIILADLRSYRFYEQYNVSVPAFVDHIDLAEVSPGSPQKPSLKLYAGRLHSGKMQDLPIDPDRVLTAPLVDELRPYHVNDLVVTGELRTELAVQVRLRELMSDEYGLDLRSKSDAQMAEAVIKAEIERITRSRVYSPEVRSGVFRYKAPAYLQFETHEMLALFDRVLNAKFAVGHDGIVRTPESLEKAAVVLGGTTYNFGIGGLHSYEKGVSHVGTDDVLLLDRDVTSYYPNIILGTGLYPKHLGANFLTVYRTIYERRIAAKKSGDKNTSETLKIVLNGSFGKFGSPYSVLYSPDLMIQTTIGGQLLILMLIERLFLRGFEVVSANTDGFVTKVPVERRALFEAVIFDWECDTGLNTEETRYLGLHSRDVNNYIAIKDDGKVKLKGAYAPAGPGQAAAMGLKKNPTCEISIEAAVAFLKDGTPIEETVYGCDDLLKFVAVRRVQGGAEKDGKVLGKAIRMYYAQGERGCICRVDNGNTVPRTEGARPLMDLPDECPDDIDHDWYIREAYAILEDVGFGDTSDPALAGRTGTTYGRLPKQKTLHVVALPSGIAACGKSRRSIRESWVEHDEVPAGHRVCSKCRKEVDL